MAVGIFTRQYAISYRKFNQIRSKFAHDIDYKVSNNDLQSIIDSFTPVQKKVFTIFSIEKKEGIAPRIKNIIQPLLFLLLLQGAVDNNGEKNQYQLITIEELEELISKVK